jgi:hypothetical protein
MELERTHIQIQMVITSISVIDFSFSPSMINFYIKNINSQIISSFFFFFAYRVMNYKP